MDTEYWRVGDNETIDEAAALIRQGEVIAFPTETVYGLGADARSTAGVEKIFAAKGRPADNPLIVHISELAQLDELVLGYNETERRLMERLWPGPLALVLPARPGAVSPRVTAGLSTVAVRMPDHPLALRLITAAGCPIAAPSANRSGRPSPTCAEHVMTDMEGRIAGVLDGGATGIGLESTVIQVTADGRHIHVLRPGGVTAHALRAAAPGATVVDEASTINTTIESPSSDNPVSRSGGNLSSMDLASPVLYNSIPRSPGMKYTHYAPQGRLILVHSADQDTERVARYIHQELDRVGALGETTGVLTFGRHATGYRADVVVPCGSWQEPADAARGLYAALRRFDELGATYILAEAFPEEGLGQAIMNRLRKAAGEQVYLP
ncbi:MAG: L-threonylcarbamoyladenylate synthase [Paenibacillaceae bacterium]